MRICPAFHSPLMKSATEAGVLLHEYLLIALCSTCKMKYCTDRVFIGYIDQAYFILWSIYASYVL